MFIPSLKEAKVINVKKSPINKDTYTIILASQSGKQVKLCYHQDKMEGLLQKTGASNPEELKGRTVVISDKKVAFLPEGAELTTAARDKDGNLIEFDFLD